MLHRSTVAWRPRHAMEDLGDVPRPMPSKNCPPGQARHKIPWSLLLNRSTEEDFERRGKNMGGRGVGSLWAGREQGRTTRAKYAGRNGRREQDCSRMRAG